MPDNSMRVVARIKALPHTVADVRSILTGLIDPTRNEAECITYELWQNREDATDLPSLRSGQVPPRLTLTQQASILRMLPPDSRA